MASRPRMIGNDQRDALTGLPGPGAMRERLTAWQAQAAQFRQVAPVHVMLISLGRIDAVNLAYGEDAGDGALVAVAERILHFAEDEFAAGDWIAARMAGGSFMVAAREACSRERWQWLGEALADAVAHPISGAGDASTMRLWPRIALMRAMPGERPQMVFDRLGDAIDDIRARHGQRMVWSNGSVAPRGISSAQLEADLLAALDRDEIEIVFQPQFSLPEDCLIGAEALARWHHPMLGRIGASTLFAIAERADHVAQLSRHIAEKSFHAAAAWPQHLRLSLNVTPADLAAASFASEMESMIELTGFSAQRTTLEITEHVLLGELERSAAMLNGLRRLGIRVALDDFGAGFCNFRYLKLLPLDYIKLDRAMVEGITETPTDRAVFRAMIAMAGALGLQTIAEGIETEDQRNWITAEGCDFYQGYFRAAPMSPAAFMQLAQSRSDLA